MVRTVFAQHDAEGVAEQFEIVVVGSPNTPAQNRLIRAESDGACRGYNAFSSDWLADIRADFGQLPH